MNTTKVHFTHRIRIKTLYKEGYTIDELAIMYKTNHHTITNVTRGIIPLERI